jgi:hypothetical protein
MMRTTPVRLFLLALVISAIASPTGCRREELPLNHALVDLEDAETFDLLSLDPHPGEPRNSPIQRGPGFFHGWEVLGRLAIEKGEGRHELIHEFNRGLCAKDLMGANCFWPRHGIHAVKQGRILDFVICFECFWVQTYDNEYENHPALKTSRSPQPLFEKILKDHDIPAK